MPRCVRWLMPAVLCLLLAGSLHSSRGLHAQVKPKKSDAPLLIVTVASVERLLEDADYLFASIERPELSESINGALANMNDLKGMNRDKPAGLLLYLNGLVPETVAFAPVENIDELMKTLTFGPINTNKVDDTHYEILRRGGKSFVLVKDGFAFMAENEETLEGDLGDPVELTRKLNNRYDFSVSVSLRSLAPTTRELFMNFTRAGAEASLQRRDDEPESAHRIREAAGRANLETISQVVRQGDELTIGWNVSGKDKNAALEFSITADPKSEMAAWMKEFNSTRSYFANLLDATTPLSVSSSWLLDKNAKTMLTEMLAVAELRIGEELGAGDGGSDNERDSFSKVFQSLAATIKGGRVDFFTQFLGDVPGEFSLVGGLRVEEGNGLSSGLTALVSRIGDRPELKSVELNVAEHGGVTFHRIQGKETSEQDQKIYGANPALYVGASDKAIWFAVGGDGTLSKLKGAIDAVSAPAKAQIPTAPFQFRLHASSWLNITGEEGSGEFQRVAREAFTPENDTLRVDLKPIEDGMRMRIQFDEGFVRLLGLQIAKQIESAQ